MKKSTSVEKRGIQWTSRMQLDDLDLAEDLAIRSHTQQQLREKTISVAVASAALGLNIHKGKRKILRYNTTCTNPVTIDREDLEDVKTFTYVGSIIDEHGGSDADVKARIGKARAAYLQLNNIWNSKQLSVNQHQDALAGHNQQQPIVGENKLDLSEGRDQEEALEGSKENITSHLDSTTKNIEFSGFCDSTLTHLSVKWIHLSQKSPWLLTFIFKLYANDYYTFDSTNFNYVLNDGRLYILFVYVC
ncbi:unnamed protein product [Schistosoma curassoni]|uniref:PPM-type phosphatase domain-containing protein n=1 Tax=Schistosoma curassoni TaxID=6186 RepID=A0A183KRC1_9TREM|nr:unnamed protein product [Schistosoma curassoni]